MKMKMGEGGSATFALFLPWSSVGRIGKVDEAEEAEKDEEVSE